MQRIAILGLRTEGSALVEFAIVLPLLVVFLVGIYDFSGAFNQKQKIEHAAQEGAVVAGAQPMTDMANVAPPASLQPVLEVIYNSLAANNVVPQGTFASCTVVHSHISDLKWRYRIDSCCPDTLEIVIDRGWVPVTADTTNSVGTQVTLSYPYHWHFNSAIQLLFPGASYTPAVLSETATVHNQL